jgi:trigger factor
VKTTVQELAGNRVRLDVEVPESDVTHALEHAAHDLAASARIPGFRKGKVPPAVVAARVGRETLWAEAVQSHFEGWYWSAAQSAGIQPVGSPEVELGDAPDDGATFSFSATVPVLSPPEVGDWTELEVPRAEPEVPAELVDAELESLRASVAELVPAGERAAREGDTVVVDIVGDKAGTQRDYVTIVGSGRLVDELDDALPGLSAGETKEVALPDAEGAPTTVELVVKEIKEPVLPELDDSLARAASEFDTLDELRADIESRLREQIEDEVEGAFRQSAADALVDATKFDVPQELVDRRAAELFSGLARSLERRGIGVETYLSMTGQSQEEIIGRLRAEADRAVRRELVLEAVATKLGVEIPDEQVEGFVREQAALTGDDADETLAVLRERGTFESLRTDLRMRAALDEVAGSVKPIPVDLARAREQLWTPDKEENPGSGVNIWTPGSEEAAAR